MGRGALIRLALPKILFSHSASCYQPAPSGRRLDGMGRGWGWDGGEMGVRWGGVGWDEK